MENNKQSSVRWTIEELEKFELGKSRFFSKTAIINHADRLHKQQIIAAHTHGRNVERGIDDGIFTGEQYYIKEYGGEKSSKIEISDEELEHELLNFLYGFEYEVFPHSASYKFDYEACAKALTQRFKEILKNKQ